MDPAGQGFLSLNAKSNLSHNIILHRSISSYRVTRCHVQEFADHIIAERGVHHGHVVCRRKGRIPTAAVERTVTNTGTAIGGAELDEFGQPFGTEAMSAIGRYCSLIPGLGVNLSAIVLAGPTVLSAVGVSPPHDGVR